jgi:Protein of unknown function (DUF3738)
LGPGYLRGRIPSNTGRKGQAANSNLKWRACRRENKSGGPSYSSFSLDNGNAYFVINKNDRLDRNGTLFSAKNQMLMRYIIFAYKLSGTQELALRFDYFKGLELHVPEWVKNDGYDIEARAPQPATKDQLRLMMQSLLAERFKLQVHFETREAPVFALVQEKPGTLGSQLDPHLLKENICAVLLVPVQNAIKNAHLGTVKGEVIAFGLIDALFDLYSVPVESQPTGVPINLLPGMLILRRRVWTFFGEGKPTSRSDRNSVSALAIMCSSSSFQLPEKYTSFIIAMFSLQTASSTRRV